MKEILLDIVKQTGPLFERVRCTGGHGDMKVEAHTEDMMLFLTAELTADAPQLFGEFGLSNLNLLKWFLESPIYKGEQSNFEVRRVTNGETDYCAELQFGGASGTASYRTINPRHNSDRRPKIAEIRWDVSFDPSKSKLTELMQLTGMLSSTEPQFTISYEDHKLMLTIGGKSASSHTATVVLADDVECGTLPKMAFRVSHFLNVLKNVGARPCTIRFSKDGVGCVSVKTDFGGYNYILRGIEA